MPLKNKYITPTYIDFYRQFKHPLKYYENLQKILDARATKRENILHRKNLLEHKRKYYFQPEFERVRGLQESQLIRGMNSRILVERLKQLQE